MPWNVATPSLPNFKVLSYFFITFTKASLKESSQFGESQFQRVGLHGHHDGAHGSKQARYGTAADSNQESRRTPWEWQESLESSKAQRHLFEQKHIS